MKYEDYTVHDALGLAGLVARREVTPGELLDAALARLDAVNPKINALAHRYEHLARAQIDAGLPDGPLRGVPFMSKDLNVRIAGAPLTQGSRAYTGYVASEDTEYARRLKRAGLAIFGSTTTPEFGLTVTTENALTGKTRNPWNLERTTGGSSGGSAAMVASGVVPMAGASDGGGSIRVPAAMCGLFGMKPSRGRMPLGPRATEGWFGAGVVGVVSRSVRDSAVLIDAVEGYDPGSRTAAPPTPQGGFLRALERRPKGLRIAMYLKPASGVPIDEEVEQAMRDAAYLCADLGHHVEEAAPPFLPEAGAGFFMMIAASVARDLELFAQERGRPIADDELEAATRVLPAIAVSRTAKDVAHADLAMQRQAVAIAHFMQNWDVLLSPVTAKPPIGLGLLSLDNPEQYGREIAAFSPFTGLYNQTGQPSMSVPLHWTKDSLPVGVMFTGRFGDEATLFRLAAQLEEAKPWARKRPPL